MDTTVNTQVGASFIKEARASLRNEVKERRNHLTSEERQAKSKKICEELLSRIDVLLTQRIGEDCSDGQRMDAQGPGMQSACGQNLVSGDQAVSGGAEPFNLGVYSAFAEEVDLDLLVQGAYERGINVSFPCMMHDAHGTPGSCEQTMEFRAIPEAVYKETKETLGTAGSTRKTALAKDEEGVPFLLHPLRRYYHNSEELSDLPYVEASKLDILVCPCVAFDAEGNRLGYGAGNYDRYLSQLVAPGTLSFVEGTCVLGVAFKEQEVDKIPVEEHDIPLPFVFA